MTDRDRDDKPQPTECPQCGKPYVHIPGIFRPAPTCKGGAAAASPQAPAPGDYSCATCGFGMVEPCEHWKNILAKSQEEAPGAFPGLERIAQYPIKLNEEIDKLCDEWSDGKQPPGMWGNPEAIKFNLHTFARAVLSRSLEGREKVSP